MKIETYRIETKRTLPQLESPLLDSIHMSLGIMTELIEIDDIEINDNYGVKLLDESGDVFWYISNYAHIHDIPFNIDPIIPKETSYYWAGRLQDYDKKLLAYKKPYQRNLQIEALQSLASNMSWFVTAYTLNVEDVLEKNIQKLRIRFPDKFDANLAINKNEEKEIELFSKPFNL